MLFRFTHAALAYEGVGGKYRAVFAEPKNSSRTINNSSDRSSNRHDDNNMMSSYSGASSSNTNSNFGSSHSNRSSSTSASDYSAFLNSSVNPATKFNDTSNNEVQLNIIVNSTVNQDQLWRLFDIIPGLEYCHITGECNRNSNYATAAYNTFERAQYARYELIKSYNLVIYLNFVHANEKTTYREKIHGLEYPPGQRIIIKAISNSTKPESEIFPFDCKL